VAQVRVAILTVSDRSARGEREDETGPALERALKNHEIVERQIVPDEQPQIQMVLRRWCDGHSADLIITNGGTGLGRRDVTPEATRAVIEREVPGLGEAMRANSPTSLAYLSRQVAGVRNGTLIINLPGSPRAALECLAAIFDILEHAVEMTQQ
jgi:molybdenum cofactor synthesis domain-containing protein